MKQWVWAAAAFLLLSFGFSAAAQGGTGSITGAITGGALPGSGDAPVAVTDAVVEVFEGEINADEGTLVATVQANADGSYAVTGLPSGHYRVRATAPGYVYEYYGERFILWESPPLTVTAGSATPDIEVELDPALTVSGTVYAEHGITPLENVPVSFFAVWYDKQVWCTGADGTYTIDKAPSNAVFTVGAADDRGRNFDAYEPTLNPCDPANSYYLPVYYGDKPTEFTGDPLAYEPDGATSFNGIDLHIEVGGRIDVLVTGSDGVTPQPDVTIRIIRLDGTLNVLPQTTDSTGHYISEVLPAGEYQVTMTSGPISQTDNVTVTTEATTPVHLIKSEGSQTGSISGTIYQPDGVTPVEDVKVWLHRSDDWYYLETRTNTSGEYQFDRLPPATYMIDTLNYRGFQDEFYQDKDSFETATLIPLGTGEAITGIDIVYDGNITISGQIRDERTGLPITSGVTVATSNSTLEYGLLFSAGIDGRYQFVLPAAGTYTIYSRTDGASGTELTLRGRYPDQIQVEAGQALTGLDIFIGRSADAAGRVTNANTDAPIACTEVAFIPTVPGGASGSARTNSNGYYWVWLIPEGLPLYAMAVGNIYCSETESGEGYYLPEYWQEAAEQESANPLTFTAQNRARSGIDFTLAGSASIEGYVSVQGQADHPDPNWSIPLHLVVTPEDGGIPVYDGIVWTSGNGFFFMFTTAGIPPGDYRIWIKGETSLAIASLISVDAGNNQLVFGELRAGDADGSNSVILPDFSILANTFGKQAGDAGYDARADFNGDGAVNLIDFSLLASNYGQAGAAQ